MDDQKDIIQELGKWRLKWYVHIKWMHDGRLVIRWQMEGRIRSGRPLELWMKTVKRNVVTGGRILRHLIREGK